MLGAAARRGALAGVQARIEHGLDLYRGMRGCCYSPAATATARFAESQVARRYAIRRHPGEAILIESSSQTTYQNLFEARTLMLEHGLRDAIVVSDPLHMARALRLCRQLGIRAYGSPTPRTRFRSFRTRWEFLAREVYFFHRDLVVRPQ